MITKEIIAKKVFPLEVVEQLVSGFRFSGLTIDALSLLFISLFSFNKNKTLVVFKETRDAFASFELSLGSIKTLVYFPSHPKKDIVPGFENDSSRFRQETLVQLSLSGSGVFCLSTTNSVNEKDININPSGGGLVEILLLVGSEVDIEGLLEKFDSWGYLRSDFVYDPKTFARRGDILDVFPDNKRYPIRFSFEFDTLVSIGTFNPDTQKTIKNLNRFCFQHYKEENKKGGVSLANLFNWGASYVVEKRDNFFSIHRDRERTGTIDFLCKEVLFKKSKEDFKERVDLVKNQFKNDRVFNFTNNKKTISQSKTNTYVYGVFSNSFFSSVLNVFCITSPSYLSSQVSGRWDYKKEDHEVLTADDLSLIKKGDFLVHKHHGVCAYEGLSVIKNPSSTKECLALLYSDGGRVFVPLEKIHLVHRYISTSQTPKLSALGNKKWQQEVLKTKKAVELVSKELLSLYSQRQRDRGFRYAKNGELMSALEKSFPYIETEDQTKTIKSIFLDLEKDNPMDRLVCGDVGFGKTEVAIRASLKVIASGKQVLVLCPTTVLSDQHFITFSERLTPLGVNIGLLSRFKTRKEQSVVLDELKNKKTDLIVGTHRVLSGDLDLSNVGLLVVDEEHRFGVKHKEQIRGLKSQLDVLSLSATPIPRTLQQSLLGIRDISKIMTPPKTRKPITTDVLYFDWLKIKTVIKKELDRGGQVYYLHNRVISIPTQTEKLRELFPDAVVDYIHGQQETKQLEQNLLAFFSGKVDILVCSTIIESGLDVSNANCIVINNAQNLGLSQMYQIRGRVGRGYRQANCYLVIPKSIKLEQNAFRRLKTIEQHTSLGSGYDISAKDLEIRGSGSLFGYKQSGQIGSVGFEMYCDLLKEQIDKLSPDIKTDKYPQVTFYGSNYISEEYIENEQQRLFFYEKISKTEKQKQIDVIKSDLTDRFGLIPKETENMLSLAHINILYKNSYVRHIFIDKESISYEYSGQLIKTDKVEKLITSVFSFRDNLIVKHSFKNIKENKRLLLSFNLKEKPLLFAVDNASFFCRGFYE
tara:strand:+ start:1598 stop:4708 length:3111 start_codon:yes stop_codon:yes gene_type:complete